MNRHLAIALSITAGAAIGASFATRPAGASGSTLSTDRFREQSSPEKYL